MDQQALKQAVAQSAAEYIRQFLQPSSVVGVGTGSTADLFIDELAKLKGQFAATVASSERTAARLRSHGIEVLDLNQVSSMPVYIDGADEVNSALQMIKGGGGALTREKIVASVAQRFICIVDQSKKVDQLGAFGIPVEVIQMSKACVTRALLQLGASEVRERPNYLTDNGHPVLDAFGFRLSNAVPLETQINGLAGVVTCGLFARQPAFAVLMATPAGVKTIKSSQDW